jgi:hypothetical protein
MNESISFSANLVVSYYGSAIDRSKKQPVFQIIMEYVDGFVNRKQIELVIILFDILVVVCHNIFRNLDNFKNLL